MTLRTDKVASVVNRVISAELLGLLPDYFLAVTETRVSADLKHAKLWVSGVGYEAPAQAQQLQQLLDAQVGRLQKHLRSHLKSKFVPQLEFKIDKGAYHAQTIAKTGLKKDSESS